MSLTPAEFSDAVSLRSLCAFSAPWRLPQWPTWHIVRRSLCGSWHQWSQQHRLPGRARSSVRGGFEKALSILSLPAAPPEWKAAEDNMRAIVRRPGCLVRDDKNRGKAWSVNTLELACSTLAGIAGDPS